MLGRLTQESSRFVRNDRRRTVPAQIRPITLRLLHLRARYRQLPAYHLSNMQSHKNTYLCHFPLRVPAHYSFCSQSNNVGRPHLTPLMLPEFLTNSVITSPTKAALAVHTTTVNNNQIFHTSDVTHCPRGAPSKLQQECCNNFTKIIFTKTIRRQ